LPDANLLVEIAIATVAGLHGAIEIVCHSPPHRQRQRSQNEKELFCTLIIKPLARLAFSSG
jgi:hypothetical protein